MERGKATEITNLPIDLLVWIVKDNVVKPTVLKTFLYLKLSYNDRVVFNDDVYKDIANGLNINVKTAKSHLSQLTRAKFINLDKRTSVLFIRSKYRIVPKAKRISKYNLKIKIDHFKNFTEYLIAAVVAYMVKKRMAQYKKALINDGAERHLCKLNRIYRIGLPISLSYIAKFLGKSISWVNKYKQKAKRLKLIKARRNWLETGIEWKARTSVLLNNDISLARAKKYRGKLYLVDSDLLQSNVMVIKRKKSV